MKLGYQYVMVILLGAGVCVAAPMPQECLTLRLHGKHAEANACFDTLSRSADPYLRAEGFWGLEQYDQANEEFRIATAADDGNAPYKVRWGMLLHQRFNNNDAVALFKENGQF